MLEMNLTAQDTLILTTVHTLMSTDVLLLNKLSITESIQSL